VADDRDGERDATRDGERDVVQDAERDVVQDGETDAEAEAGGDGSFWDLIPSWRYSRYVESGGDEEPPAPVDARSLADA